MKLRASGTKMISTTIDRRYNIISLQTSQKHRSYILAKIFCLITPTMKKKKNSLMTCTQIYTYTYVRIIDQGSSLTQKPAHAILFFFLLNSFAHSVPLEQVSGHSLSGFPLDTVTRRHIGESDRNLAVAQQ